MMIQCSVCILTRKSISLGEVGRGVPKPSQLPSQEKGSIRGWKIVFPDEGGVRQSKTAPA